VKERCTVDDKQNISASAEPNRSVCVRHPGRRLGAGPGVLLHVGSDSQLLAIAGYLINTVFLAVESRLLHWHKGVRGK
jgi:hypothetical protein